MAQRTTNQEPRTTNNEPGTRNNEPGTTNQEPRTRNNEPRTTNSELGTKNQEPSTTNPPPMNEGEIIIYQAHDLPNFQIEVLVDQETVWLNRQQIALLFDRDVKTIGKHTANALNEELNSISVIAKFATTTTEGKTYRTLDRENS